MRISGIYKIQSKLKPKRIYIGSAINILHRWRCHISNLRSNKHPNNKLQNHFNKYGEMDLQFSVLVGCNKENLIVNEQFFIDSYNPYFNICKKAQSRIGTKGQIPWNKGKSWSKEVKDKLSTSHIGQKPWNKGIKGAPQSEETKRKRSQSMKGKNTWRKGMSDTESSRLKKSIAQKKRRLNELKLTLN